MQTVLILLLFVAALGYLGRRAYQSFTLKKAGCGKGCGCAPEAKTVSAKTLS